jgi:hypothetical protein
MENNFNLLKTSIENFRKTRDSFSDTIGSIEKTLAKAGINIEFSLDFTDETGHLMKLSWCPYKQPDQKRRSKFRLLFTYFDIEDGEITKPLQEHPLEVRLKTFQHLATFVASFSHFIDKKTKKIAELTQVKEDR